MLSEDKLFYPVTQLPNLKFLVITGNPFALQQDQQQSANVNVVAAYTGTN